MRLDALTDGDIESALAQVTELATELLRVERASVWRFDKHGLSIECLDLFEAGPRRHSRGTIISQEQAPRYFDALMREPSLAGYHLLPSARADLLAKLGRIDEARAEFERAASLTQNARQREQLLERARGCMRAASYR